VRPNSLLVQITIDRLSAIQPNLQSALQSTCEVNYDCDNSYSRSIIGRIDFVTCEIPNSSAQMASQAGEVSATTYNCDEQLPEYGILIPGLNFGFSIAVSAFAAYVLINGDGQAKVPWTDWSATMATTHRTISKGSFL
jgi:hypothetical protein